MTEIEKKALALVNEVRASHGLTPYENLYATPAAIEKHGGKIVWGEG